MERVGPKESVKASLKSIKFPMDRSMLTYTGEPKASLGVVVHANPDSTSFQHAIQVAREAIEQSCNVYIYLLDEAVRGVSDASVLDLIEHGAKVSACGFALEKHGFDCPIDVCPAGLTTLSDIMFYSEYISVYN